MIFEHKERVYYSDTDCGGIAYHRAYFDWAEHARSDVLRLYSPETVVSYAETIPVVTHIDISYHQPSYLDDEIRVLTELGDLNRFSAYVIQRIYRGDVLLADLSVKFGFIDSKTGRPQMIPESFRSAFSGGEL